MFNKFTDKLERPEENSEKESMSLKDSETVSHWSDERSNLLSILEKNEKIVSLSQSALAKDRKNLLNDLKATESILNSQISRLNEENSIYKSEISRLTSKISVLSSKLQQSDVELQALNFSLASVTSKLQESGQKNTTLLEKLKKSEITSKQREEKLQLELNDYRNRFGQLEIEVSSLSQRRLRPEKKAIPKDQLASLMTQKKELEDSFMLEKNSLIRENSKYLKITADLKKQLEAEKTERAVMEKFSKSQLKAVEDELNKAKCEVKRLETEVLEIKKEAMEEIEGVSYCYIERELEFEEALAKLQKEFTDYKTNTERHMKKYENTLKYQDILNTIEEKSRSFNSLSSEISSSLKTLTQSLTILPPPSLPTSTSLPTFASSSSTALETFNSLLSSLVTSQHSLETQQSRLSSFLSTHVDEVLAKEKQMISQLTSLSTENLELHKKLSSLNSAHLKSADQAIKDLACHNQQLLQKLSQKSSSKILKLSTDLHSHELNESLSAKTIKSLNAQLLLLNKQLIDSSRLSLLTPPLLSQENSSLKSYISSTLASFITSTESHSKCHEALTTHLRALSSLSESLWQLCIQVSDFLHKTLVPFHSSMSVNN